MKRMFFAALAAAVAAAAALGVPPVVTTNAVIQKWGAEAENEIQGDGVVFWRDDKGMLYVGDGVTPGGKAVCVGHGDEKWYSWTNDVSANGHKLKLNQFYSIQAESSSMVIRYGSNVIWRIIGDDSGELANITAEYLDPATLRIQAVAAGDGVTLQVCTDLMAAEAWSPATNAVVMAETDVSTTWDVTLGAGAEFYRVLAVTTREKGIYAERPLVASEGLVVPEGQGITMGTNTWSYLPDMEPIEAHVADTDNPHGVTAEQAGALPVSGGTVYGDIVLFTNHPTTTPAIIFDRDAGGAAVDWKIQNQVGNLRFQNRPGNDAAWRTPGVMFSTGGVVSATGFSGGADDLTVGTNTLGSWVAASEAAVASVERRLEAFERTDTCTLFWNTNVVNASDSTYILPTNFPTPKLRVYVVDTYVTNIWITTPQNWDPDREVEIFVIPVCLPDGSVASNRNTSVSVGEAKQYAVTWTSYNSYREAALKYYPGLGGWISSGATLPAFPFFWSKNGYRYTNHGTIWPTNAPATVDEWLALHPEWATP